ncbi:MAG: sulfite exporter TauE/SafE family protein, partial [Bacteroidia bacterium]|nr:sulfite exporter TauE/SafE family protein [Bacteroidia bacterium]
IGTAAWIFLVINLFKLPFQIFYWNNISATTLQTDMILVPALLLGFWAGTKIVSMIKNESYRKIVIALTLAGAIVIFLK